MEDLIQRLEELAESRRPFIESLESMDENNAFAAAFLDLARDIQRTSDVLTEALHRISTNDQQ